MDLELNEEHQMIRDAARDFAQNEIAKVAAHYDETGEFPYETINKMGQLGFMGIEVPEEYHGVPQQPRCNAQEGTPRCELDRVFNFC